VKVLLDENLDHALWTLLGQHESFAETTFENTREVG